MFGGGSGDRWLGNGRDRSWAGVLERAMLSRNGAGRRRTTGHRWRDDGVAGEESEGSHHHEESGGGRQW